ncbi:carbohydrate ABC transporter permease [Saliterribacillus persicus]|uniref:Carbohydrate ABC transporter membrane protein 2 (CUT1 family) n=1 Tax=Saliterribacillus persicus TaxID=930114 RepID=A0A368XY95_9BACI|nr:carbohydrate ABC transporter permease [Saliterribacillus persicus]RCW72008.1 carbohydrate ABC transporter membrane protein 2 (CUT1 family) [Saliterribacillus persicus]
MHKMHNTPAGRVFDVFNHILLIVMGLVTLVPFLYVIAGSFATEAEIASRPFFLIPETITLDAYRYIFSTTTFIRSIGISIFVTILGTIVSLLLTLTMAYPLSRHNLLGRGIILNLVVFTMVFNGGMIPTYMVVRNLGLIDSLWALILPVAINPFYLIIVKSFFQNLPTELEEAAKIDGCSDMGVFWKIVIPLSKPVIATFTLFYAVFYWNDFFNALLYISDSAKWPVQLLLQQLMMVANVDFGEMDTMLSEPPEESLKLAVVVVATLPILVFYPFLQKHFAKGILLGSVKG